MDDLDLSNFVGKDSWSFSSIMKIDPGFLDIPVSEFGASRGYVESKEKVDSLDLL